MELHQIRYFAAICEAGNISQAATKLHMAQPSLSEQLRKLEHELGVQLVVRMPRRVVLTQAGVAFRDHATRILREVELTQRHLDAVAAQTGSRIRMGVLPTVGAHVLGPVIADFRRIHPTVDVVLREENSSSSVEHVLREGQLDIAVIRVSGTLPTPLTATLLLREPLVALVPPDHHLAPSPQVTLAALGIESFITLKPGYGLRELVLNVLNQAGVRPQIRVEVSQITLLMALIEAGLGVTILPRLAIDTHRHIAQIHIQEPHAMRELYTVWRRDAPLEMEAPLRTLIEGLSQHAACLLAQ